MELELSEQLLYFILPTVLLYFVQQLALLIGVTEHAVASGDNDDDYHEGGYKDH